jgi:hypothetical protein
MGWDGMEWDGGVLGLDLTNSLSRAGDKMRAGFYNYSMMISKSYTYAQPDRQSNQRPSDRFDAYPPLFKQGGGKHQLFWRARR